MKISVITAVYNRAGVVARALASVADQTHADVEHVIVDGASTDGSLEVMRRSRARALSIVSEPDAGIYDALNKGILRATGEVVGLLHSDDVFADAQVLADVAACFLNPAVNLVYGNLDYVARSDANRVVRHWHAGQPSPARLRAGWMPPHPTVFVRAGLYRQFGLFSTRYRIAADYELMLRLFLSGQVVHRYLPRVLVRMMLGGESNRSLAHIVRKSREDFHALKGNGFSLAGAGYAVAMKNLQKVGQFIERDDWPEVDHGRN
jgi:glycosyltransferase involved in cell wall biosynthesis